MPATYRPTGVPMLPGKRRKTRKKSKTEAVDVVKRAMEADKVAKGRALERVARQRAMQLGQAVQEVADVVEQALASEQDMIDYMIDLYLGRLPLNLPADKRYVAFDARSSAAVDTVNRIMGLLGTDPSPVFVPPSANPTDITRGQTIQRHLEGVDDWMRKEFGPVADQAFFWQVLTGKSFIQQTYLPAYWDKNETRRRRKEGKDESDDPEDMDESPEEYEERANYYRGAMGPPMMRECLDPRVLKPVYTSRGIDGYIKHYSVQRLEIIDEFKQFGIQLYWDEENKLGWQDITGKAGLELPPYASDAMTPIVDYYEFIDDDDVFYVVEDQCIYQYEHKGAICIEPAYGLVTGFKEAELSSTGVLFAVRNLIPQLDFLLTLWFNKAYIDVFPQLFEELPEGVVPTNKDQESFAIEPMSIRATRGKVLNPLAERESSMDFKAVYETVRTDIEFATISGEVRGIAGANQSGNAIAQALDANKANWRNIPDSRAVQWGNLYSHYLYCVKHVIGDEVSAFALDRGSDGRLTAKYYVLKPDDIPDFYQVLADCEPKMPIDAKGDMLSWMKASAEGQATDEEVSRYGFRRNDWEDRRRQVDRDHFRRMALPSAMEDAIALGRVRVQGREAEILGIDKLNPLFQAALQPPPTPLPTAGGPPPAAAPPPPTGEPGANGAGLGEGNGIPPTYGTATTQTGPQQGVA